MFEIRCQSKSFGAARQVLLQSPPVTLASQLHFSVFLPPEGDRGSRRHSLSPKFLSPAPHPLTHAAHCLVDAAG